jgi:hypothetical protein
MGGTAKGTAMRAIVVLGLTCFAHAALAQTACLAPPPAGEGPVSIRDAKIVAWEAGVSGGAADAKQTVVRLQACAVIAGNAAHYVLNYRPVLFTSDGHLLAAGSGASQRVDAEDPKGGPGRYLLSEDFSVGYVIDHAKLPHKVMVTALSAGPCTPAANGACTPSAPLPAPATVEVPVCLADGTVPPPPQCAAGAH